MSNHPTSSSEPKSAVTSPRPALGAGTVMLLMANGLMALFVLFLVITPTAFGAVFGTFSFLSDIQQGVGLHMSVIFGGMAVAGLIVSFNQFMGLVGCVGMFAGAPWGARFVRSAALWNIVIMVLSLIVMTGGMILISELFLFHAIVYSAFAILCIALWVVTLLAIRPR